jgi:hypothetical protein
MPEKAILSSVILGYRQLIEERYQYANLQKQYDLPASFDEDRVQVFRNYFLDYLYPDPAQRAVVNAAFEQLEHYVQQPEKLMRLLLDSGGLVFKYGWHLPRILGAGIKALKSFLAASRFEQKLVDQALETQLQTPFGPVEVKNLLRALSPEEIDHFIDQTYALFETLHDRTLVQKVIEIIAELLTKMKQRPQVYGAAEIAGLTFGLEVITKGNALFDQLDDADQQQLFDFVIRIERDALETIF